MTKFVTETEFNQFKNWVNTRLNNIGDNIAAANTSAVNQAQRLTALENKIQRVNQNIGPLTANTPLDITILWPTAWPAPDYGIWYSLATGNAALGTISATLKAGSKTTGQCIVTVQATIAIASAGLDVVGVRA